MQQFQANPQRIIACIIDYFTLFYFNSGTLMYQNKNL